MLDVLFIILESFLKIIYIDKSIIIAKFFKLSKIPIYLPHYHRYIILKTQSYIAQKLIA